MANISIGTLQAHCKILGKYARIYDDTVAGDTSLQTVTKTAVDQVADQLTYAVTKAHMPYLQNALNNQGQGDNQKANAIAAGIMHIQTFLVADIVATPAGGSVAEILAALNTDMVAGSFKFDTLRTSGLYLFFNNCAGTAVTLPTTGTTLLADATYVVDALVV